MDSLARVSTYRLALLGLITVALLLSTSTWLLTTTKAHAAGSYYSTWCQNWDPNPANTTGKEIVPGTTKTFYPDGSAVELDQGYYQGTLYVWANLSNAPVGAQIAMFWRWIGNSQWYQCGDSHGYNAATVSEGSSDTWTAGVPADQLERASWGVWNG